MAINTLFQMFYFSFKKSSTTGEAVEGARIQFS